VSQLRRFTWRIGRHWLNSLNTFEAPACAVVDASIGYRFKMFTVSVLGTNLGDRRDAAQLRELGEGQFYDRPPPFRIG
jgi:outer membrane receptor protein involved in Fe transport